MKRRDVLRSAGLGLLGAAAAVRADESPGIRWRLASSFPKSVDAIYGAAERVARRVGEITDGRFQIRVFAGGEIVPGLQVLDAVG
ncbi:MAG: ABC transporter substrate-binding protein, partial [Gammaproteobacteria bacterium]|nr:ABC transporter substrate-binding protein [Gammaproteobacteria bacterium]